jgi:hypothetical protein
MIENVAINFKIDERDYEEMRTICRRERIKICDFLKRAVSHYIEYWTFEDVRRIAAVRGGFEYIRKDLEKLGR